MNSQPKLVYILGAGISGLSTAYALKKRGVNVTVLEANSQPGGVMQTFHNGSWMVEKGPNTLLIRDQRIWNLLDDLKLRNSICKPGNEAKKRYIVRNRKPCAAPMGLVDFLKTDLLSISGKLRLLKEPFAKTGTKDDESIARFIRRRLGSELLDYAVNPFVSGIYAGDPEKLSVKHAFSSLFEMEQQHGSITKGFFKREKKSNKAERALISFKKGLQQLPSAIADELGNSVKFDSPVEQLSKSSDENWEISFKGEQNTRTEIADAVISTLPLYNLPQVFTEYKSSQELQKLSQIEYAPMSSIALGFKREQVGHSLDGFGLLIPEKEPYSLLGCLFSSTLFENRAPKDHILLSCFIGGAQHPQNAHGKSHELIDEIMPQLRDLLNIEGSPVFHHHTFWGQAIPQYTVGYDNYLNTIQEIEQHSRGLYLSGNYRGGVSVPDCILNGLDIAERVYQNLK